jgi:drug/metabolite transporter (DMT)-like permease
MSSRVATITGSGAILLWSLLALLGRGASALPPFQVTAMAFGISGCCGLVLLAITGRFRALRQPPIAWVHGVGGLFGYHACYFAAIGLAPVAEANLINYVWPLLIVLFSAPLLGMRLRRGHLEGVALGVVGCVVLLGDGARTVGGGSAVLGDALAFAAGSVWALYSVLSRRLAAVPTASVAGFCAGSAVLAGLSHMLFETTVTPDAQAWVSVILLGLGPTGTAFFLWDAGMKRGDPRLLGILAYATPVASTLVLCAAGVAALTPAVGAAAVLVAAGGLIASRA